ncbi:HAD family hydrolase [Shouchella clausii]|uniref:HAD family hydrolase n=1 Tax=Shouchella clausii TaxID=79880 RepID=UPI0027411CC6|nr:HAD family hydrolase [Shouchella clausii]MDP5265059.1 HAD family hydrolase [Shouchella clausii]
MIRAIFFDLDDTLLWDKKSIKEAFRQTCALAATVHTDIDPDALEEAVRTHATELYQSYETYEFTKLIGINPFEGLWGAFRDDTEDFNRLREIAPVYQQAAWEKGLAEIGIEDGELANQLASHFPSERRKNPYVFEDTFAVLDELQHSYRLLLLTNGSPDLQNTKLEITPQLVPYFDHILISGAYGKGKPDAAMFKHALELSGTAKEEVLMVGDNLHTDILGGNQAGIETIWLNRDGIENTTDIRPTYEIRRLSEIKNVIAEKKRLQLVKTYG